MNTTEAIGTIVKASRKGELQLAMELGKPKNYITNMLSRGGVPRVETLATIANACGFDLVFENRRTGEHVRIDPPGDAAAPSARKPRGTAAPSVRKPRGGAKSVEMRRLPSGRIVVIEDV